MALAALEAGFAVEDVAQAVAGGPELDLSDVTIRWTEWTKRFKEMETQPDPKVQALGRAGHLHTEECLKRERHRERQEAIHGDGRWS